MKVRYAGVDVGKQKCRVAVMDENGFLVGVLLFYPLST
jgi:sugar (pentulose or hexulose) kinase